ncbi:gag-protease polyprotein [Cucumis melo var. makuwa]|uniref:Gag-protease polyprotein n=1 Tax=Cucumis melo var. makuwa TaxID=1194695 RepID=A0A5A7U892_CUCMM|nr:gag-protease polyprotein [Cucumis melo var. makuwa]
MLELPKSVITDDYNASKANVDNIFRRLSVKPRQAAPIHLLEGSSGGRGTGCVQPKEQPTVQTANLTTPFTQADLAAMEQWKYNLKTFDEILEDPTKTQMWLAFVETIFWYMRYPNNQKVQCVVFLLTDRGTTWWQTIERMLGSDINQITWE